MIMTYILGHSVTLPENETNEYILNKLKVSRLELFFLLTKTKHKVLIYKSVSISI